MCSWIAKDQRRPTRSPAVTRITDHTGCHWPWRSSKVDDFHLIWKGVCHFLLVINSSLDPISHRARHTAIYSLKLSLKIAAKPLQMVIWLLLTTDRKSPSLYLLVPSPTPYDLRLATIPHDWHSALWSFKVIQCQSDLCHVKASMRLLISDQQQPWLYFAPFNHNVHPWQTTDGQTDRRTTTLPIAWPLLKYGWLKPIVVYCVCRRRARKERVSAQEKHTTSDSAARKSGHVDGKGLTYYWQSPRVGFNIFYCCTLSVYHGVRRRSNFGIFRFTYLSNWVSDPPTLGVVLG